MIGHIGLVTGMALHAMRGAEKRDAQDDLERAQAVQRVDSLHSKPMEIPRRLNIVVTHRDYHPSYIRVGIKFDGVERKDVKAYDMDTGFIELVDNTVLHGVVEPFWRYKETRQQRRARQAWEAKRK